MNFFLNHALISLNHQGKFPIGSYLTVKNFIVLSLYLYLFYHTLGPQHGVAECHDLMSLLLLAFLFAGCNPTPRADNP